jgi:Uma2 family endonuclease
VPVSLDWYLGRSFRPDLDYVDGILLNRNAGLFDHANLMGGVAAYLLGQYPRSRFMTVIAQRVRVSATRIRVPDVCIARAQKPMPQIFRTPPLIAIEILSPEDRVGRMRQKIDDYLAFGVPNVWLIDPQERRAFVYTAEGSVESADLVLRAHDCEIVLPLPEIFSELQ